LLSTIADVASTSDLDVLLVDVLDKSIEVTGSERGFLLLCDNEHDPTDVQVRAARDSSRRNLPLDAAYGTSVAKGVLENGEGIASVVQGGSENVDFGQSVYDLKLRAVMCVPLASRGNLSGAIYVDSRAERKEYTQRDLAFFAALAQQLAVSIENAHLTRESIERARLARELELARDIQARLLPRPSGMPADIEIATWYQACEAASGDTFDVLAGDDGRVSILLGDVSGHGIGPALIANSVQAAMRSYLEVIEDLADILRRINDRLLEGVEAGSFMSLFLAHVDTDPARETGRVVQFVNAGHGCAYVIQSGDVQVLPTTTPVLGMVPELELGELPRRPLESNDIVFLCSDGLTEARNAERDILGEGPLLDVLRGCHGRSAEQVVAVVRELLEDHIGEQALEDDVMLLAMRVR